MRDHNYHPTNKMLRDVRDQFGDMLERKDTPEKQWQMLFSRYPFIFSLSLPIKLLPQDIKALGRPGQSEPDFIFFPSRSHDVHTNYGVIELKTPHSPIITRTRKNIFTLSRSASTAMEQAATYIDNGNFDKIIKRRKSTIFVGNDKYIFIIMGLSNQLCNKFSAEIVESVARRQLPGNFKILPYDYLYKMFSNNIPNTFMMAVASDFKDPDEDNSGRLFCPNCNGIMKKQLIDRWYFPETRSSDSDGPLPRYVDGMVCHNCEYEVEFA